MNIRSLIFTCLIALLTMPGLSEEMVIDRYSFENPLEASEVGELGLDAYTCHWPAQVPYSEATLELVVVSFDKEGVATLEASDVSPYDIALTNFLGIYGEPKSVNKTLFFGLTSARKVYEPKIPRPHELHVYSKTLEDGSFLMVAVRSFASPNPDAAALNQAIANTFKVKDRPD
jgi:hypothetical protein